ncbi:MAG: serine/threonine protein kinase [Bryobacterales bacterium]|nr:serine/threonine protein kinase [Bryobacterales bacterium]
MQFPVGRRVGDYEIVEILGAGGMGKVYKVRNVLSDRIEAMKVLLPDLQGDSQLADRFLREIKVQASLTHPNIAGLHTALTFENQLLMVMEFIDGMSIEKMIESGPLPLPQALDYTIQVLQALGYAHSRGVIHRDIKPANMMVTRDGVVKLMDFGIARMRADKRLTQTGHTVGSLFYMSPEQIRGDRELDPRADLYSLGVALYEITTGKRPFEGNSDFSIMAAHLQQNPVPPIQVDPSLPEMLNEIILMSIAKDPAGRFQSADAFRNALTNVLGGIQGAVTSKPVPQTAVPPPAPQAPPPARSNRGVYMALGSLVTVGVLAVAAFQIPKWFGTRAAGGQQPPAVEQPQQTPPPVQQQLLPQQQQQRAEAPQVTAPASEKPPEARPQNIPLTQAQPPVRQQPAQRQVADVTPPPQQQQAPPQQQPAAPRPVEPPPPAQTQPANTATPVNAAELDAVRERMMKLATRAGAVQAKARRIESEQRSQGLGMRSDVVSGIGRMTFFMDEVEKNLNNGNAAAAKSALQKADRETETLERILGII